MGRCHQGATLLSLFLLALGPAPAPAQSNERTLSQLLEPIRKKYDLPALAAAVVNQEGLVAAAAVGVRERGDQTPVTVNDQFHLGSDTKAMTATLLATYIEKGQLKWQDTLGQLFPDLAGQMLPEVRRVTVEQLLTHHAGLPQDLPGGWRAIPTHLSLRRQREEVLRQVAVQKLQNPPGRKYAYSNLGYTVAGHITEQLGNADWEELMARQLFRPLDMKTAGFGPMGEPDALSQPRQHGADGKPVEPGPRADNPPVMGPTGRVHCSLPDWAKFIALLLRQGKGQPALLKPALFQELFGTPFQDSDYRRGAWAGSSNDPEAGGLLLHHDGSNKLNYSSAWVAPERGLAVLVATNQGGKQAQAACADARQEVLAHYLPAK
jgi:CubicO group peptidase (beta-lactamase class C family)